MATIPAGKNNANGIIPHPFVIATLITLNPSKILPTTFVFFTTNVITIHAM
jgi:hypothetical protein